MSSPQSNSAWKRRLKNWSDAEWLHQHEDQVLLVLTLIIGALVGLVVAAFIYVTESLGSRMYPAGGAAWRRLTIPVSEQAKPHKIEIAHNGHRKAIKS